MKLACSNDGLPVQSTPERKARHLIVAGINYHSTPLEIRERLVIPAYCLAHALGALAHLPHVKEAALLSTCNRTEVFAVVTDIQAGMQEIESFFLAAQNISDHGALKPNFKLLRDDVALHLFRVAAGLDSMVLGEGQIMSQVKAAQRAAQEAGTLGPVLDQLFKLALNCGKRVRTETAMARRAVSVSSAAVELAKEVVGPLKSKSVVVIGAGKMAKICVKHLLGDQGPGQLTMINRTAERIEHFLANRLPNRDCLRTGLDFTDRYHIAAAADVVIVSTSAPKYLLTADELRKVPPGRNCLIIDISVPRNVDPEIAQLPGFTLFDSDHLQSIVNKNLEERELLVAEADHIVFESLSDFHGWQRSVLVAPTITGLRKKIESIRLEQMRKSARQGIDVESSESDDVEQVSRAIVNQILHHPTVQLKATNDYAILKQQAEALRTLFNLDVFAEPVSLAHDTARSAAKVPGHAL